MSIKVQGVQMKLFNRRKNVVDPKIPPEVQAYSQAEHRERMGMAWLVGVVSLVLTAFVLTGLFFGGRWLYRTIAGPSKTDTQSQQATDNEQTAEQKEKDQSKEQTTTDTNSNGSTSTGNGTTAPATPAPSTPAPQPVAPAPATNLPHTGPDSDE